MATVRATMEATIAELKNTKSALLRLYKEMDAALVEKEKIKEGAKKNRGPDGLDEMTLFWGAMVDVISKDLARMRLIMDVILALDRSIKEKQQVVRGLRQ